ncbi:MAG: hypothetical protein MUC96_17830 [Myxococcaceae bacterium]|nr:hypothetical protein [Myxococcaceae bacterium]
MENLFGSENIRGLVRLERVTGPFDFSSGSVGSVSGASELREVGSLSLIFMNVIQDVELPNLEVIHGDFYVSSNPDLQTLAGLRSLRLIEGKLILGRNPKLRSGEISAFTSRVTIDGGVERM